MGRKTTVLLVVFMLAVVFVVVLFPSLLFAAPIQWTVESGGNGHYYELRGGTVPDSEDRTWEDAKDEAISLGGYLATITSQAEADFIRTNFDNISNTWIGGFQPPDTSEPSGGWTWVTSEPWGTYVNWASGEPNDSGGEDVLEMRWGDKWTDWSGEQRFHFLVEYEPKPKSEPEPEPEVWIRDKQMQCFQVWVNADNNFEFVFWWVYANNNHVQIYDMAGNLVWETDFEKDKPHFEVDLPDGMYTVKTFHEAGHILQEFLIGKP